MRIPRCRRLALTAAFAGSLFVPLHAQTPPPPAKRLPPAGIAIPDAARAELTSGATALRREIDALQTELTRTPRLAALLPDVEIYHKAVDWALRYDEFFAPKQVDTARHLLDVGRERAMQLRRGAAPWLEATGLVIRGYRSRLDDSIQPYGLVVPPNLPRNRPNRLMVWLLGRGEKRSELAFIAEREAGPPQLMPRDTIVLVPYGRFCNATKFAGEVDVFEAMAAVRGQYSIDPDRMLVAGFSMGGASTWHLATHHAGLWCAASPGAGFAEVATYTKAFAPGKEPPTGWEQKLWRWYNATDYAGNLFNCPTIAYSGEIDPQKQSADLMERAMADEGLKLARKIGRNTAHKYHPETKNELTAALEALMDKGRDPRPRELRVTTYTLRYPGDSWLQITGLEKHWERADALARVESKTITVTTKNVSELSLTWPRDASAQPESVVIDGQKLSRPESDGALANLSKENGRWKWDPSTSAATAATRPAGLRKTPGRTGPIDDAFMERFVFVRPTGEPLNPNVGSWARHELAHATKMWRDIFRADALVKDDTAISDQHIAGANLILWGDPLSNRLLARILPKLPLQWDANRIVFRGKTYGAANHAPVFIFPNPLNPARYIVLNSGIDFRDHAYGTNSLQIPKLPDFAIIDLREPPGSRWPGKIVDAGFFDEQWK
ncbi:MAG: prolyl oligopeptidase family serine peptidase [Opitutaceae bacterium]|nr:prolyl oligopeptidase family serine peptidase [Opitutaceae bacterium]